VRENRESARGGLGLSGKGGGQERARERARERECESARERERERTLRLVYTSLSMSTALTVRERILTESSLTICLSGPDMSYTLADILKGSKNIHYVKSQ
jgi:hypothetical protein